MCTEEESGSGVSRGVFSRGDLSRTWQMGRSEGSELDVQLDQKRNCFAPSSWIEFIGGVDKLNTWNYFGGSGSLLFLYRIEF